MEAQVSELLENILGLLGLEGSFEVVEEEEQITVTIETNDAGRLIGFRGETLDALQLLLNQMTAKKAKTDSLPFKRVVIDVSGWRKNKEEDLEKRAQGWAEKVLESGQEMELEPMPSWQRRIVHLALEQIDGVTSESVGEGKDRHMIIKLSGDKTTPTNQTVQESESTQSEE